MHCADCGTKFRGGFCTNCHEEAYIREHQAEYIDRPLSDDFNRKADAQEIAARRARCGVAMRDLKHDWQAVPCPVCAVPIGKTCKDLSDAFERPRKEPHQARVDRAKAEAAKLGVRS